MDVGILWYSSLTVKTLSAHWPSGKADWTPDYSHPTPMQWSFSGTRDFNSLWPGERENAQIVWIWPSSCPPTNQEEVNSLSVYSL